LAICKSPTTTGPSTGAKLKALHEALLNLHTRTDISIQGLEQALSVLVGFKGSIDQEIDGKTVASIKKFQKTEGQAATGWATPYEIRRAICKAATKVPEDDFSRIYLANMYHYGIGFARDDKKADFVIKLALKSLSVRMIKDHSLIELHNKARNLELLLKERIGSGSYSPGQLCPGLP